ncbi:alpha/beta hydrolase [Salinibius halmophilus]|uniref:alpha/beta hydrolase n=1 Tax=Salinibius halmophilus TaxID=1853216 RepID=UPI000E6720F3|nr:alpha/beta hydrolase [Salinibius halmophilus]
MYSQHNDWQKLQPFLPEQGQLQSEIMPHESMQTLAGFNVHLDSYLPKTPSKVTVILLHGVGGNGRLLSFLAVPLLRAGIKVICPDLPGYGYSETKRPVVYQDWINVGCELANQTLKDEEQVFVFGLSTGGMLAYNIACHVPKLSGLLVTNILDNRLQVVRDYSAKNKLQSRFGIPLLSALPKPIQRVKLPVRWLCNMNALVNDQNILKLLLADRRAAGGKVSLEFLLSMIAQKPLLEPEDFKAMPACLLHPDEDEWTPTHISELFFDRIASPTNKYLLTKAGHFPIEQPGYDQLVDAMLSFVSSKQASATI